jgi:plasmid stability protein
MSNMIRWIRNLDPDAYRALKARANMSGRTIGDLISDAIRSYLARPERLPKRGSLRDLTPEDAGPGSEHLSDDLDAIVYPTP